ncbi:hypothetical protein Ancab_038815 [Ancistrocladus abbreviatus]
MFVENFDHFIFLSLTSSESSLSLSLSLSLPPSISCPKRSSLPSTEPYRASQSLTVPAQSISRRQNPPLDNTVVVLKFLAWLLNGPVCIIKGGALCHMISSC